MLTKGSQLWENGGSQGDSNPLWRMSRNSEECSLMRNWWHIGTWIPLHLSRFVSIFLFVLGADAATTWRHLQSWRLKFVIKRSEVPRKGYEFTRFESAYSLTWFGVDDPYTLRFDVVRNGRFVWFYKLGSKVQGGDVDLCRFGCSWNSRFFLFSGASISCLMER